MGEVYRATDTTLARDVAIKVLPEAVAQDAERLARFDREAKTLATLNHPGIAHIYGVEDVPSADSGRASRALVMELVEGPTLADRLAEGPIPIDEALPIAQQIAGALEAAHERGIVHRDLKPANIKLRPDGTVKVLDFGLAKAMESSGTVSAGLSQSPTITSPAMTQAGLILGTAAYMSPEQARGRPVDRRTDIWAFGVVLYEMLSGRRAFSATDVSDTIALVLTREVDWDALPASTPPALRRLVRRCLARDQAQRLRDMGDVVLELQEIASGAADEAPAVFSRPGVPIRQVLLTTTAIAVLALAAGFGLGRAGSGAAPAPPGGGPVSRGVIDLPADAALTVGTRLPLIGFESPALALSPDGRLLVYVGQADEGTRLYYREMNSFDPPRPLPDTDGALYAFFSPDGTEIGFLTPDRVRKTAIGAGSATTLSRARTPLRASWVSGDLVYFFEDQGSTLSRVAATGGDREEVYHFGGFGGIFTDVLPDGRAALLTAGASRTVSLDYGSVQLLLLDTLTLRSLLSSAYDARYLPSGHLQFARAGALMAVAFDLERLETYGDAVAVGQDVAMESLFGNVHTAVSPTGTLAYVPGADQARGRLAWVDRDGTTGVLGAPERVYGVFDVAPDERRIAATIADVEAYVWIWDEVSGTGQVLATPAYHPRWDFGGERVAFNTAHPSDENGRLVVQNMRGGAATELLSPGLVAEGWSRNGLLSISSGGASGSDVGIVKAEPRSTVRWLRRGSSAWGSALSPEGRFVSYGTDDSGRFEIWVEEIEGPFRRQVSTDGGVETIWCPCDELFYRNGNRIYSSRITYEPAIAFGPPRVAFVAEEFIDTPGISFDVSSDGRRLYYVRRTMPPDRTRVRVVHNWFEELRRLVPVN